MSNLIETTRPTATLSAAARKAFTSFPCADMARGLIYRDGVTDDSSVTPSDVRMTTAAAAAALGAKMTPQSFVAGLVFAAVRHAHGNQFPVDTLPAGSKIAIAAACETLPRGKGCNARMLLGAVEAGIAALLSLPAPTARTKASGAIAAPAAAAPAAAAPAAAPAAAAPTTDIYVDGAIGSDADGAIVEAAANAAVDTANAVRAKALADAAEAAEYRAAQAARFAADAKASAAEICREITKRADAAEILRELAGSLGFTLRKAASRKAA